MHPEDIKASIRKGFGSVRAFEQAKGLANESVRDVLRGKSTRRTAEAIAEYLDKPMSRLFPGRFKTKKPDITSRNRDALRLNDRVA